MIRRTFFVAAGLAQSGAAAVALGAIPCSATEAGTERSGQDVNTRRRPKNVDEVEEFRATMLARQIEAEEAFVHGNPEPRMELWSRRDPLTLFGAIGMSESGWDQLSQTFTWVVSRFAEVSDFRIDVELVEVSGDLAYVLWFERFNGSIAGRPVEPVTVRVTHIYRREDGEWKIVHRHADNPGHDPRAEEDRR